MRVTNGRSDIRQVTFSIAAFITSVSITLLSISNLSAQPAPNTQSSPAHTKKITGSFRFQAQDCEPWQTHPAGTPCSCDSQCAGVCDGEGFCENPSRLRKGHNNHK